MSTEVLRIRLHDLAEAVYRLSYAGLQIKPIRGVLFTTLRERLFEKSAPDEIPPESHLVNHHEMRSLLTTTDAILTGAQTGPAILSVTIERRVEAPGEVSLSETFAVPEERAPDLLDRIEKALSASNQSARESIARFRRQALPNA